jgi:hypothetical protein
VANHDYVIDNGTGAAVRADLNDALAAIVSNNSSVTEPATTYAYQWWADTTSGDLKIRNAANSAWITVGTLASANLGLVTAASPTFSGTATFTGNVELSGTGYLDLPSGTNAQRPGSPNTGMLRFNTTSSSFEGYNGTSWGPIGGAVDSVNGQTGAAVLDADDIDDTATTHKFATAAQLTNADNAIQPTDSIDALGDVDTTTVAPTDGQVLAWDNAASQWEPATAVEASKLAKAWVNFNGTGTVAIRSSYNVSSITDNGTGDYTVNFTTAMVDADYCATMGIERDSTTTQNVRTHAGYTGGRTASSFRMVTEYSSGNGGGIDLPAVYVAIFR